MQLADTNPDQISRGTNLTSATLFSGTTSLDRRWGRSSLNFNYNANESVFTGGVGGTQFGSTHQVGMSSAFVMRRWSMVVSEALSYAPQSSFGLGPYGGLGGGGQLGFGSGLSSDYLSNESILTGSSRLSSSTVLEVQRRLSARSSLSASVGYSTLRFFDSALFNSSQYNFSGGFTRRLTVRDSISVNYLHFWGRSPVGPDLHSHAAVAGYTRQLAGRLALQVSGGPQIQAAQQGLPNSVSWTMQNALLYRWKRNELSASYGVGIAGGAGIYRASRNHTVTGALSRPLSRAWAANLTFGYGRNSGLGTSQSIASEYGGVTLGRSLYGKGLSFSYQFQHQSVGSGCSGLSCSLFGGWRHSVGLGFDWLFRPVRIS